MQGASLALRFRMREPFFAVAGGLILVATAIAWHLRFRRAIARPEDRYPKPARYPSVTVIRPVRGRDVGAEDNFAAALASDYPGEVETLFVFDDPSDPGVAPARAAIARHERAARPGRAAILFCGPPPAGRTGKLHAMAFASEQAQGELVAFGDSDTRPPPEILRVLVEALLAEPDAGAAFAPVVAPGPAHTVGDAGYQLLINALYGPAVALVAERNGRALPFIMGQIMVFQRAALRAVGGVACAEGQLVDDMYIGAQLARAGFRNIMVRHPLPIITGGMGIADFLETVRRWMLQSRSGLPASFARPIWVSGAVFWLGLVLAASALAGRHAWAALAPAAAVAVVCWSLDALQHQFGGARFGARLGWCSFFLFLVVPPIYFATRFHDEMQWRGRAYPVDHERRLAHS